MWMCCCGICRQVMIIRRGMEQPMHMDRNTAIHRITNMATSMATSTAMSIAMGMSTILR